MSGTRGDKIKLGIFVIVALSFFTVAIYFIGQKQRLFSKTFRIKTIYKNVNGLQPGNTVRFVGINVGNVDKVTIISDTSVEVDMLIDKSVKKFIKKDAVASVGSEGLMGDKLVLLAPGSEEAKEISNNDYIPTSDGSSVEEIMNQVKVTAQNAATITNDMADIVGNIKSGKGAVGKLLMDTVFAANLDQTLINVKEGAGGFKENMEAAQHNILLRGYFKKKEKAVEKHKTDSEKQ